MAGSKLDQHQILQALFDDATQRLKVDAQVTSTIAGAQEVIITHLDDSIKVGDGVDFLSVNPDGSLNTLTTITDPANYREILQYNEINNVASGGEVTITTYVVPLSKQFFLHRVQVSGDNIASYKIRINNITKALKRTWFTGYNEEFNFNTNSNKGLELGPGDTIAITVTHNRTTLGTFNANILGLQEG